MNKQVIGPNWIPEMCTLAKILGGFLLFDLHVWILIFSGFGGWDYFSVTVSLHSYLEKKKKEKKRKDKGVALPAHFHSSCLCLQAQHWLS